MNQNEKTHTISVLVENEFGVLARVAGMFAGRGFNIDALSVAPTPDPRVSRMTIITHGNALIIEQILKQLNRLIDVLKVVDVSSEDCVRRELMLVKVRSNEKAKGEIAKLAEASSGKLLDASDPKTQILEFVGEHLEMESILKKLQPFEILEVVRTGNIAMQKGKNVLMPFPGDTGN
ncbi:MAG: acetolactate synthase small subunit [bacterium]